MKISAGWVVAVVFFGVIIVLAICGRPKPKGQDVMEQRLRDTAEYYQGKLREHEKADSIKRDSAADVHKDLQTKLDRSDNALNSSQTIIHRLIAKVEGAKLEPRDSTFIPVSPHYISGCDSLKDQAKAQQEKIDQQQEDGQKLTEIMKYEIAIRDSSLNAQKDFTRKFSNQLDDCMTQLQSKAMQKPRNQVYAGVGLFGNKINPLAGGQVNISLKTKRNQIYEVTGATVGNTWYGGFGTKFLITFR